MPDLNQIKSDPEFLAMPMTERVKVLAHVDSEFAGLPQVEQMKVAATLGRKPLSMAETNARLMRQNAAYESNPPENRMPQPNALQRFGTAALDDTSRLWEGLTGGNESPTSVADIANPAYYPGVRQSAQLGSYLASDDSLKHKAANLAMANPEGIEESSQNRDYASLLGHTLTPLAAALLPGRVAKVAKGVPSGTAPATIDAATASEAITNAVNPPPKAMPAFKGNVANQLPSVVDFAKENGIELNSRAGLADAFEGMSKQMQERYYKGMLQPVEDSTVSTRGTPYKGDTISHIGDANLGQLEKRLSTINNTLRPVYEKGGKAAQAAIGAKTQVAMKAEAAWIRSTLNSEIGRLNGIDPEAVGNMRASFGQMSDVADKIRGAVSTEQHQINTIKNAPKTFNPFNKNEAVAFALDPITQSVADYVMKRPADRAISKVMPRYKP